MNEVLLTLWFDSSPTRRRLGSALPCAPALPAGTPASGLVAERRKGPPGKDWSLPGAPVPEPAR
jgi:hypothetical protein